MTRSEFPKVLGLIGTDISTGFADKIFEIMSKNSNFMQLNEYLNYVDIFHYGTIEERCEMTFKIMDSDKNSMVYFEEFEAYLNVIMTAINKVHTRSGNFLSREELF